MDGTDTSSSCRARCNKSPKQKFPETGTLGVAARGFGRTPQVSCRSFGHTPAFFRRGGGWPWSDFSNFFQKVAQRGRRQKFSKSCEVPSRKFWRMCNAAVRSGDVSARRAAGNATICKWHCVPAPPVTSRSILWTQPYFRVNHLLTSAGRTQPPPSKARTETHADAGGGG